MMIPLYTLFPAGQRQEITRLSLGYAKECHSLHLLVFRVMAGLKIIQLGSNAKAVPLRSNHNDKALAHSDIPYAGHRSNADQDSELTY